MPAVFRRSPCLRASVAEILLSARDELLPRLRKLFKIRRGTVINVTGKEHDVGLQVSQFANQPPDKSAIAYMSKMSVAYQGGGATAPVDGQVWQRDLDPCHPQ